MHRLLIPLALVLTLVQGADAATITAAASGGPVGNPLTDVDGPTDSGQVLAQVTIPIDAFANLTAGAALDVAGNSALSLNGVYLSSAKRRTAGIAFPQVTDAMTTWTSSVTNNSAVSKRYVYSFLLHPIQLLLNTWSSVSDTDPLAPVASFGVEVRANNVLVFESHALLKGGNQGHVLNESGTDLGGVLASNEGALWYDFAQFQGVVPVGTAGPNETITVETKLIGHTEAHFDPSGGTVSMGDPLDIKGDPGLDSVILGEDTVVGVAPATWSAVKHLYN